MKSFSYLCEIQVTVVLLFLVPVFFYSYQQELLLQGYAQYQVTYFTDSVRNTGYISAKMYEEFKKKLAVTNHIYDVEISVYRQYHNAGTQDSCFVGTYTDTILEKLYKEGEWFTLKQGDFIAVSVKHKDKLLIERLLGGLGKGASVQIPIQYGGMVRDECF